MAVTCQERLVGVYVIHGLRRQMAAILGTARTGGSDNAQHTVPSHSIYNTKVTAWCYATYAFHVGSHRLNRVARL